MRKQFLHISAYPCDRCSGPVIACSFSVRESEITKPTEIKQAGAMCVSCGYKQDQATEPARARHLSPVEWEAKGATAAGDHPAFLEALSHAELR